MGEDIGDEGEEVVDEKVADVVQVIGHDEERRTVPQLAWTQQRERGGKVREGVSGLTACKQRFGSISKREK